MKTIDTENWIRKEYFDYFSNYDNPFFSIVAEVDCTKAYESAEKNNLAFFAYYLHKSSVAVNMVEELKFRIIDNKVVVFDTIHAGATIGRTDGTFGFSFIDFSPSITEFAKGLKKEINNVQNSKGLRINEGNHRLDVIHYSVVPWIKFTSVSHSRKFNTDDSIPKITFGKTHIVNGKRMMPVSIEAHHGFVDGLHVAKYLDEFQELLNL